MQDQNQCKQHLTDEHVFTKDLREVWHNYKQYNSSNTLLVDDSRQKSWYESSE